MEGIGAVSPSRQDDSQKFPQIHKKGGAIVGPYVYYKEKGLCLYDINPCLYWRARQDSNLRPTDSKSGALSS